MILTPLLIRLGLRSKCCGGRIETWSFGKHYCGSCGEWLERKEV